MPSHNAPTPGATRRGWLRSAAQASAWLALPAAGGLVACTDAADQDHSGPEAPRSQPLAQAPRVAWVFSSGGPRGFVHVGVVQALQHLQLRPDLIVGASAGALVGVMAAAGLTADAMREQALSLQPWQLARMAWGADERFSAMGLAAWVNEAIQGRRLEQLATPMVCATWNRPQGRLVGFNAGDAGLAVAAASAIEGQLAPVMIRGEAHVDADLHQPLPVRLALALGAQRVLAVDASAHEWNAPEGTERWRAADRRKRQLTQPDADAAHLLLHPDIGYYANITRSYRERVMDTGYRYTLAQAERLVHLHR